MRSTPIVSMSLLLVAVAAADESGIRQERVRFAPGTEVSLFAGIIDSAGTSYRGLVQGTPRIDGLTTAPLCSAPSPRIQTLKPHFTIGRQS